MLLFLNLLALIIFIFLPQGKDVIYIVSEDILSFYFGSLLWLLLGLICWSYVSEFACRYAIYVTDNSGVGLSDQRVKFRKELQRTLSSIFLILPYFIVLISILINFLFDNTLDKWHARIGFGVPALLTYLLLNITAKIYFFNEEDEKGKRIKPYLKFLIKAKKLNDNEQKWAERLYGIYNDFVFTIRKPDNFKGEPRDLLKKYIDHITSEGIKTNFPQNDSLIESNSIVPHEFRLKFFTSEPEKPSGRFRWVYYVPNSFYKSMHRQLMVVVSICILVFLIITFLPLDFYQNIGTPGLLMLSFSCWIGIYLGVLFIDYGVLRPRYKFLDSSKPKITDEKKSEDEEPVSSDNYANEEWSVPTNVGRILSRISIRFILLILLILCSFFNDDHPVRYNSNGACCNDNRPGLKEHFITWFKKYSNDSATQYRIKNPSIIRRDTIHAKKGNTYVIYKGDTLHISKDTVIFTYKTPNFYPVVFICAEGGAMRTGAFTAILLSYIQDHLLNKGIDFHKSIYAFSAVSGGFLGVSFFNAEAFLNKNNELLVRDSLMNGTMKFFGSDFLAPVIGKMFYGDLINLFLPCRIERFDRAIALEKSWENAYQKILNKNGRNYFSDDYMRIYSNNNYPAIFANTTEVESGRQCWISNVIPDSTMFMSKERDLLNYKLHGGINYSTMINFSTRFPLISPGAMVRENDDQKLHYVDGGYVENTGSATMIEILKALSPALQDTINPLVPKGSFIKPYVIQIRFSEESNSFKNINFGNEISEILYGIYNTREGRTEAASNDLEKLVHSLNGEFIPLNLSLSSSKVPMNWVLSDKCLNNVWDYIDKEYNNKKDIISKLFPLDTACYQCPPLNIKKD